LFHPAAMSRVRPVQGLLSSCSCLPHRENDCPLAVVGTTTHRPRPAATIIPPRLRGFAPHEAALPWFGVNRPTARSPRQVSVSSRCSPASPCAPVPQSHPLMTLPAKVFAHTITSPSRLQRIPGEWLAGLSPDCRPARDF
jgi:hypothetical protein